MTDDWRGEITLEVYTDESFVVGCPPGLQTSHYDPGLLYGYNNLVCSDGAQLNFDYKGDISAGTTVPCFPFARTAVHPDIITMQAGQVFLVGIDETVEIPDEFF